MTTDWAVMRCPSTYVIGESVHGKNGRRHTHARARWTLDACGHLISKMVQPSQVVAHAMSHPPETMGQPEQEVGHGTEQGAVPARLVDAGVLRQLRILGAV